MKLKRFLLLLAIVAVLVSCASPIDETDPTKNEYDYDGSWYRYIDREFGVVCYSHYRGGVDCVQVDISRVAP